MCLIYFSEGLTYCLEHRCFVLGGERLTEEQWRAEVTKRVGKKLSQTPNAVRKRERKARLKGDGT